MVRDVFFALKGDTIVCPSCGRDVFRFRRDIRVNEARRADDLEPIDTHVAQPRDSDAARCPFCVELLAPTEGTAPFLVRDALTFLIRDAAVGNG